MQRTTISLEYMGVAASFCGGELVHMRKYGIMWKDDEMMTNITRKQAFTLRLNLYSTLSSLI